MFCPWVKAAEKEKLKKGMSDRSTHCLPFLKFFWETFFVKEKPDASNIFL